MLDAMNDRAQRGPGPPLYEAKNASLDLSLDIASRFDGDFSRKYLKWFLGEGFGAPKSILDIGCESGLLTCFYASVYPDAEVLGIDRCMTAIARAEELQYRSRGLT